MHAQVAPLHCSVLILPILIVECPHLYSDHSLGRCVLHAARAKPVPSACRSLVPAAQVPPNLHIGMCFAVSACNVTEQVTCHRYKTGWTGPGGERPVDPVRTTQRKGYYRHYSSVFDGNKTDTN